MGRWHVVDPRCEDGGQESWSPYHYVLNNPVKLTDPDGRIFGVDNLIGAAVGALVEYGGQVAANALEGRGLSSFTSNIDMGDIMISAGEGFVTSGASTLVKAVATIGTEVARNGIDWKTAEDGSGKVDFNVNTVSETTKNTAIGLTLGKIGDAAPAAMNVEVRSAKTVNQAVKAARTEAKTEGKVVSREMNKKITSEAKAAQSAAKKTNETVSKTVQNTASNGASTYVKDKTN
ncbi:MAG: hypothetical protein LLG13_16385 [Bacteroidales bacterium]|nr:hypothetical protein [Bacteroidales bacterium]